MSINEVVKKYLPVDKQKLSYSNKAYNYCSAYIYENCANCKENKRIRCAKKLIYHAAKQISETRWHLYFLCSNNHLAIRWVVIDDHSVVVGQIKN